MILCLISTHLLKPGVGFNIDPATLDGKSVASYAAKAHGQTTVDFLMHIIPDTLLSAFAQDEILQILLIALLFGAVLATAGDKGKPVVSFIDSLSHILFGIVRIITKLAPIGAMAFTIGKYNKAEYAEQRRTMLQVWADMLDGWIAKGPAANDVAHL